MIYKDGPSITPETSSLKLLFQTEDGIQAYGIVVDGRFQMHTVLHDQTKPSMIKRFKELQLELEAALVERGLTEYYTLADSLENFRFCEMFGFRTAYIVYSDKYELMIKELV